MAAGGTPRLISIHDGYARFAPAGSMTVAVLLLGLEAAMHECQRFGQARVLVDFRALIEPLTTADRYDLGSAAAEFWERSIRVAVVLRADQIDRERFGQRVAINRGLFVAVGTDEAEAMAWLLRPESPTGPPGR